KDNRRFADLPLWVLVGAAAVAIYSPLYLSASDLRALGSPQVAAAKHAVTLVPNSVPVAASNHLAGYLAERRLIYAFPYVGRARWIVLEAKDETYLDERGYKRVIREYKAN